MRRASRSDRASCEAERSSSRALWPRVCWPAPGHVDDQPRGHEQLGRREATADTGHHVVRAQVRVVADLDEQRLLLGEGRRGRVSAAASPACPWVASSRPATDQRDPEDRRGTPTSSASARGDRPGVAAADAGARSDWRWEPAWGWEGSRGSTGPARGAVGDWRGGCAAGASEASGRRRCRRGRSSAATVGRGAWASGGGGGTAVSGYVPGAWADGAPSVAVRAGAAAPPVDGCGAGTAVGGRIGAGTGRRDLLGGTSATGGSSAGGTSVLGRASAGGLRPGGSAAGPVASTSGPARPAGRLLRWLGLRMLGAHRAPARYRPILTMKRSTPAGTR